MQRENVKPKENKAKHGLMIRPKYLILVLVMGTFFGREAILGCFSPFIQGSIWPKEKEGKEKEKRRRKKRSSRNQGLEILVYVWVSKFSNLLVYVA